MFAQVDLQWVWYQLALQKTDVDSLIEVHVLVGAADWMWKLGFFCGLFGGQNLPVEMTVLSEVWFRNL